MPEEFRRAAELLERRWLLSILYAAHSGALRFNEFKQILVSVPPRTLAQRLTELEDAGVLERRVLPTRPPAAEYRLTRKGEELGQLVEALQRAAASI